MLTLAAQLHSARALVRSDIMKRVTYLMTIALLGLGTNMLRAGATNNPDAYLALGDHQRTTTGRQPSRKGEKHQSEGQRPGTNARPTWTSPERATRGQGSCDADAARWHQSFTFSVAGTAEAREDHVESL